MAFGRNQSAPMARTLRWCGSSMCTRVRMPMPASIWALKVSSTSAVANSGRGSDRNRSFARSTAMMSSCLVIAQNGRYGGLSTQATGLFARNSVSAVCNRLSSAYAVGSARTLADSSIVRGLIESPEGGLKNLTGVKFAV